MKKIKVILKDKTILELQENAEIGDIIDLSELLEIDTSFIDAIIEEGKDKVYESKLNELKRTFDAENQIKINELLHEIDILKNNVVNKVNSKETEVKNEYEKKILEILNGEKIKYKELELKYNNLINRTNELVEKKELELKNEFNTKIVKLESDNNLLNQRLVSEIEKIKINETIEKERALNVQEEKHRKELSEKDEMILNLQRQKTSLNIKQLGEDLESWCDNEVVSYMQNGLLNCRWIKDNKVIKNDGDDKGSKADYIFNIYSTNACLDNELLTSICLDMKDESPDSKNKQTNEHYYKKLDENRKKKGCQYSVLVSNLELDKPNILPIFKVREYENMYVVRPAYLMTFLNMITSLVSRFKDILTNVQNEELNLKSKNELIEEFNKIKETYLDNPLEMLNKEVESILKYSEDIRKSVDKIDTSCEKIKNSYINKILDKLSKFEIKLNKNIAKKID